MSAADLGESLNILLVFKNDDVLTWLPDILTDLGHQILAQCTGLKDYRQQLVHARPFPSLVITDYTAVETIKQMQQSLHDRGGVAPFILVGKDDEDESILNASREQYIFGREVPSTLQSPLKVRGTIMGVLHAFRTIYPLQQFKEAQERWRQIGRDYERALTILMKRAAEDCPSRPAARKFLTHLVTSRNIKLPTFLKEIFRADETFTPRVGKANSKFPKKPPG